MLADPACIGNLPESALESWFEPGYWAARNELAPTRGGRGAAWFVGPSSDAWVLRHYRRGGFIARLSLDRYIWAGEERVRSMVEWRLLEHLVSLGLPVPKPVAARYQRVGLSYRCDLITWRIPGAQPLSEAIKLAALGKATWRAVGAVVARVHHCGPHEVGVDHADLNAHNILIDGRGVVSVIDFDRGRLRTSGSWRPGNLQRLRGSLLKISRHLPPDRFTAAMWDGFMAGYQSAS
jgi:3-deoxy-D-manno-octulosonic acid kinase